MKTKERCGKLPNEAGMCVKTKEIQAERRYVVEKTGSYQPDGGSF
jgi:hypothetical protein